MFKPERYGHAFIPATREQLLANGGKFATEQEVEANGGKYPTINGRSSIDSPANKGNINSSENIIPRK